MNKDYAITLGTHTETCGHAIKINGKAYEIWEADHPFRSLEGVVGSTGRITDFNDIMGCLNMLFGNDCGDASDTDNEITLAIDYAAKAVTINGSTYALDEGDSPWGYYALVDSGEYEHHCPVDYLASQLDEIIG